MSWVTAVAAPVVGLGLASPMHYLDLFTHDWVAHLGPIYLATAVFVVGALLAFQGLRDASPRRVTGQGHVPDRERATADGRSGR